MTAKTVKSTVQFSAHDQNIEDIHKVVEYLLGKAGCSHCGLLAQLEMSFIGDPPPEIAKHGVVSIVQE
jgi:hypothetical protein